MCSKHLQKSLLITTVCQLRLAYFLWIFYESKSVITEQSLWILCVSKLLITEQSLWIFCVSKSVITEQACLIIDINPSPYVHFEFLLSSTLWCLHWWVNLSPWENPPFCGHHISNEYRQISNIRHTKSQNLNISRLVLHLSLPNLLKPCVKLRMKM